MSGTCRPAHGGSDRVIILVALLLRLTCLCCPQGFQPNQECLQRDVEAPITATAEELCVGGPGVTDRSGPPAVRKRSASDRVVRDVTPAVAGVSGSNASPTEAERVTRRRVVLTAEPAHSNGNSEHAEVFPEGARHDPDITGHRGDFRSSPNIQGMRNEGPADKRPDPGDECAIPGRCSPVPAVCIQPTAPRSKGDALASIGARGRGGDDDTNGASRGKQKARRQRSADVCQLCEAQFGPGSGHGYRSNGHRACCGGHSKKPTADKNGHLPMCVNFTAPKPDKPAPRCKGATTATETVTNVFGTKLLTWMATLTLSGRDTPQQWLERAQSWCCNHKADDTTSYMVEERGKKSGHRHIHIVHTQMSEDTPACKKKLHESLKAAVGFSGDSKKFQFKVVPHNDIGSVLEYLAKDYTKSWFRALATDGTDKTNPLWAEWHDAYKMNHGGVFAEMEAVLPNELIATIHNVFVAFEIADAGFLDIALWCLRSERWILGRQFLGGNNGSLVCPYRLAAYHRMMTAPKTLTQKDVFIIICGVRDFVRGAPAACFYKPPGSKHATAVDCNGLFNPRYVQCHDLDDALAEWQEDPTYDWQQKPREDVITRGQLLPWQRLVVDELEEPEMPQQSCFGRRIWWIYDDGNMGKSVLAKYLTAHGQALQVTYSDERDTLYIVAKYVGENGYGPPVIVVNIPRSVRAKDISYLTLEKMKDGSFVSTKYDSRPVDYCRPHMLVLANEPPDIDQMTSDRWRVQKTVDLVDEARGRGSPLANCDG